MKTKSAVLLVILALVCLFHVGIIGGGIKRDLAAIWRDNGQSALWRSARFAQNKRFANFVQFILQKTPPDAVILLPPQSEAIRALSTTPFMQFFLLPRRVINCMDLPCFLQSNGNNQFKIISSKALLSFLSTSPERQVMFDQEWGILLPENSSPANNPAEPETRSFSSLVRSGISAGFWIALMILGGTLLMRLFSMNLSGWALPALGYGLALGIMSIAASIVSLCGIPLNAGVFWSVSIGFVFLVIVLTLLFRTAHGTPLRQRIDWKLKNIKPDIWEAIILGIGLLACVIASGKGYYATDEIQTWGVKGYAISLEGSISQVAMWGTNPWEYPLHAPVLIASQHSLFRDVLLSSKWLFSGYFIALMLVLYRFLQKKSGMHHFAGLAALVLAFTPILFRHAHLAYANLTFNYYLVIAILLLISIMAEDTNNKMPGAALLSGLFFAFASWTRPEGLAMAWAGMLLIYGLAVYRKWEAGKKNIILTITPLLFYSFFWLIVKEVVYREGVMNSGTIPLALRQIFSGKFNFNEMLYVIKSFFSTMIDFQTWGGLGLLIFLGLILWVLNDFRIQRPTSLIIICAFFYGVMISTAFYFTSYNVKYDLSRWVSTGFDRAVMPCFILLWLGLSCTIELEKES